MGEPQDEISLRELFVIFRRGLLWILGVSLAVAVLAFVVMRTQPERYMTAAIVSVVPLQLSAGAPNAVDLSAASHLSFDTYRGIATSTSVLQQALDQAQAPAPGLSVKTFLDHASLSDVSGNGGPLTVRHTFTLSDAKLAAALDNAWADATVQAVRKRLTSNLQSITSNLSAQKDRALQKVNEAEALLEAFQKSDDRSLLRSELQSLENQTTSLQQRTAALDRNIARLKANQQLLQALVAAREQGQPTDVRTQLRALTDQGVLDQAQTDALSNAVASLPPGIEVARQDVATLVARTQLQQDAQGLAGDVAERTTIQQQLDGFAQRPSDLRQKIAALDRQSEQIQRQLSVAQNAYQAAADALPAAQALTDLAPSMASIPSPASVPARPQPHRTAVVTAVAFVLAFFAMVLIVFLRAAVAEDPGTGTSLHRAPEGTRGAGAPARANDDGTSGRRVQQAAVDASASSRRATEPEGGRPSIPLDAGPGDR